MWVVHTYLAVVTLAILATFAWITRGIQADMARLEASRPDPGPVARARGRATPSRQAA